jgi:glycosyltransferase involved in cell wall biosynthesis
MCQRPSDWEKCVKLLIAIPIHNEEKYVERVIDKIHAFHNDILVIDDGSTDRTPQLLAGRSDVKVIRHPVNRGYGKSLIDAFAYADAHDYDWVITMDCDEQHEPEKIPAFIEAIETDKWDIISGSRYLSPRGDDDLPPGDRQSINATITVTLNDVFDLGITDAFCGYKAHRVSAMRRLRLTEPGYAFPLQLWPQVWSGGLRLTEIPVRLIYNDPTRHFGGNLDDAGNRLRHYLDVLKSEMNRLNEHPLETANVDPVNDMVSCCCGE